MTTEAGQLTACSPAERSTVGLAWVQEHLLANPHHIVLFLSLVIAVVLQLFYARIFLHTYKTHDVSVDGPELKFLS